jgi:hypothetical protein
MRALIIMRFLCLLIILVIPVSICGQDRFTFPDSVEGTATNYLERMKIEDPVRQLTNEQRHALCRLFVKAYTFSIRRHRQDYLLNTSAPVYRLLVANFPEIKAKETEGGSAIFLKEITRFFNRSPDYKPDVIQVLRAGHSRRLCKQP